MNLFKKRLIVSSILILITISAIISDWICGIVVFAFIGVGLYEFFSLVQKKGIFIYKGIGMFIGLIIPISIFLTFELAKMGISFRLTKTWELLFIVSALVGLFLLQFTRRQSNQAIVGISTTIFGILYIAWLFSFLIKIKYLPNGLRLVTALILITEISDLGAYMVGSKFGKHLLIARISPKKSIEGAIGGLVFSILVSLLSKMFLPLSFLHLIVLGCLLGILAQLGDLSESLIKRDCQVKDSGRILPGLGGVLDLIDSLLFTAPAFYFYICAWLGR